jgi:hypothetical protein
VNDANEVSVMDGIRNAAASGRPFYVDKAIDGISMDKLTEMAEMAGLPRESIVRTDAKLAQSVQSAAPDVVQTPKKKELVDITKLGFADPAVFDKNNDRGTTTEKKLSEKPSVEIGAVRSIRGDDSYNISPENNPRTGEASIAAPEVKGVSDKSKSSADVIREQNEARRLSTAFNKEDWEAQTMANVDHGALPRVGVAGTGGAANNTVSPSTPGQMSIGSKEQATDSRMDTGDMIRRENERRLNSMRRPREDGRHWDAETSSVPNKVSDALYESLKKAMGK